MMTPNERFQSVHLYGQSDPELVKPEVCGQMLRTGRSWSSDASARGWFYGHPQLRLHYLTVSQPFSIFPANLGA